MPRIAAQTVPPLVNYQGRLSNPDGSPLPTADYTLTFNIYDAPTNGTVVWGPQVFDGTVAADHGVRIPVVQGYFNVMLGPVDTHATIRSLADAFNGTIAIPTLGESRYVEVTVSNRPPILPRQQILTTPFAFQAANSAKLAGYDWSVVFGPSDPVTGGIPGNKLLDGSVPLAKLAGRTVSTNAPLGGLAASPNITTNIPGDSEVSSSITLVIDNRPVMIALVGPQAPETGQPSINNVSGTEFYRDGVLLRSGGSVSTSFLDASAGSGLHTYSVRFTKIGGGTAQIANVRLVAFEL